MARVHRRTIITPTADLVVPTSVRTPTPGTLARFSGRREYEFHAELMEQCPAEVNALLFRARLNAADSYCPSGPADLGRTDDERVYERLAAFLRVLVEDRECNRCGGWKVDNVNEGLRWRDVESLDYCGIARVIYDDAEALQREMTARKRLDPPRTAVDLR